jgi:hypothetical protein
MRDRLRYLLHDLRWRCWKIGHPHGSYGQFYADFIASRIAGGERHPTLSAIPKDPEHYFHTAQARIDFLRDYGLEPSTRFVDYGCGGLRMGRLLIPQLNAGCYWGLDVADAFFRAAFDSLDSTLVAEKRPRVAVISPDVLQEVRAFAPQIIYAGGVLLHVPPFEVPGFLDMLARIMTADSIAVVNYQENRQHGRRLGLMRWAYDSTSLMNHAETLGLSANVLDDPVPAKVDPGCRSVAMVLRKH